MRNWFEDHWGWLPVIAFLFTLLTWAIVASSHWAPYNYHNETMCQSVGGVWITSETGPGCFRLTPIPFPNPRTSIQ